MTAPARSFVKPVFARPGHHFFGYYDTSPWDNSGRYLLGLEADFMHRPPGADDTARILLLDTWDGTVRPVGDTRAWNWQQGCLLQWLNGGREECFVHNDRRSGAYVAVVRDIDGREIRTLPRPVYDTAPDGATALSLNFSRLARTRPGYGYAGITDHTASDPCPADDGIWLMDTVSGEAALMFSCAYAAEAFPWPQTRGFEHWFNHAMFAPDGKRFVFLHRARRRPGSGVGAQWAGRRPRTGMMRQLRRWAGACYRRTTGRRFAGHQTRLLCATVRGGELQCLLDEGMVSHCGWRDAEHLLTWACHRPLGERYWLMNVGSGACEAVGSGVLDRDGHCTFSPDGRWLLTDTYPDKDGRQTLILFDMETGRRVDAARLRAEPGLPAEARCDLHPRFDAAARTVCVDSTHEGKREMYRVDVAAITGAGA